MTMAKGLLSILSLVRSSVVAADAPFSRMTTRPDRTGLKILTERRGRP